MPESELKKFVSCNHNIIIKIEEIKTVPKTPIINFLLIFRLRINNFKYRLFWKILSQKTYKFNKKPLN